MQVKEAQHAHLYDGNKIVREKETVKTSERERERVKCDLIFLNVIFLSLTIFLFNYITLTLIFVFFLSFFLFHQYWTPCFAFSLPLFRCSVWYVERSIVSSVLRCFCFSSGEICHFDVSRTMK